eukprot:Skav215877  [mRNA]  locus=scaffold3660:4776:6247:+ [translate_table: standard]
MARSKLTIEDGHPSELSSSGPCHRWKKLAVGVSILGLVTFVSAGVFSMHSTRSQEEKGIERSLKRGLDTSDDPLWGCGLLGPLPGISEDGETTEETQRFIDALKKSSSFQKVTYWNWNLAPMSTEKGPEYLSKDFLFVPEMWGAGPLANKEWVRTAGESDFVDGNGHTSPAQMANLFLGMNEPDIQGSCMGNMFGTCVRPCTQEAVAQHDCPTAISDVDAPPAEPNSQGMCDCWSDSVATGVGFWPAGGEHCSAQQPLPKLWPEETNAYAAFEGRVRQIGALMDKYPFVKGAIINEVGMLNCPPTEEDPICVPDTGQFPAKDAPDHGCPVNEELPEGLATFISKILG